MSDGSSFSLDLDVASDSGLRPGAELSDREVSELCARSDYERAKSRALWYLDRSDRTEKELCDRLLKAGFNPEAVKKALSRIKELGLIDDERYAKRLSCSLAEKNLSKRAIYQKLVLKGISPETAKESSECAVSDETAQIKAVIKKKYSAKFNDLSDPQQLQKLCAALVRRGFSFGAVRSALKEYSEELRFSAEED